MVEVQTEWKQIILYRNDDEIPTNGEFRSFILGTDYVLMFRGPLKREEEPFKFFERRMIDLRYQWTPKLVLQYNITKGNWSYAVGADNYIRVFIPNDSLLIDRLQREILSLMTWLYWKQEQSD